MDATSASGIEEIKGPLPMVAAAEPERRMALGTRAVARETRSGLLRPGFVEQDLWEKKGMIWTTI